MKRLLTGCWLALLSLTATAGEKEAEPETLHGMKLLWSADFESGDVSPWEPTDAKAWKIGEQNGNKFYSLIERKSDFQPPVRSPFNRSLIKELTVGSFILDVRLQSTIPDYGHRDLCLFFGFQDNSHLYYVHLGKKADPHANQIFIVNNAPRLSISKTTTPGTDWTDDWHHARIVRDVEKGTIEVYFDDMEKPAMTAVDKTFVRGRVGVGSFDDIGNFDDVKIYGSLAPPAPK